jgi:hypothetical protein
MWSRENSGGSMAMMALLLMSLIFMAGFYLGYGTRGWRSRRRRARLKVHGGFAGGSSDHRPRFSTFGHARRAF